MKRFIVTTTIFEPTPALRKFAAMEGWELVVVADKKTPAKAFAGLRCTYLSPEDQEDIDKELSDLIGWNCIQRRNMGFVYAMRKGADLIATIDDDNEPYERWGEIKIGQPTRCNRFHVPGPAFDPLSVTSCPQLWHRGFPLPLVNGRGDRSEEAAIIVPDVQAGLWDGDPDIDSVCRMMNPGTFELFVARDFTANRPAPFNSQNTILSREAMKHYFCFPHTGRMDDIYASYVVQAYGFKVLFEASTVRQSRAGHDVLKDMQMEMHGYRDCLPLIQALDKDPEGWRGFVPEDSAKAFDRYRKLVA